MKRDKSDRFSHVSADLLLKELETTKEQIKS